MVCTWMGMSVNVRTVGDKFVFNPCLCLRCLRPLYQIEAKRTANLLLSECCACVREPSLMTTMMMMILVVVVVVVYAQFFKFRTRRYFYHFVDQLYLHPYYHILQQSSLCHASYMINECHFM